MNLYTYMTILTGMLAVYGCNQPANPPAKEVAAEMQSHDVSGAYELKLSSQSETCSGGYIDGDLKAHDLKCEQWQIDLYKIYIPGRAYITDDGSHLVHLGLDNKCTGKIFRKDVFAFCEEKDSMSDTSIHYEFSISNGKLHGTMNLLHRADLYKNGKKLSGDWIFQGKYVLDGEQVVIN